MRAWVYVTDGPDGTEKLDDVIPFPPEAVTEARAYLNRHNRLPAAVLL